MRLYKAKFIAGVLTFFCKQLSMISQKVFSPISQKKRIKE